MLGEDARVIDMTSAPYSVDLKAVRRMGIWAWREPGLSGGDTVRKARSVREMHDARCKAVLLDVCIRKMGLPQ